MSDPTKNNPAVCPRCGYDLRGAVALWRESCPLDGLCTECGLSFEWAEVIGARMPKPRWCVEYAARWRGVPWRSAKTFIVTMWPWGFWKSLKMTHDVRWGWIAAHLVLLVVPLYVFVCVCHGVAAWAIWSEYSRYGATTMPSPVVVIAQSVFLPYSDASPGPVGIQAFFVRNPALFPPPSQQPRVEWDGLENWLMLLAFLGVVCLCPAGFLALPVSRRRAKVRYAHIHRVTLYSMTFMLIPVGGLLSESLVESASDYTQVARVLGIAVLVATLGFPLVLAVWWSCATGRYLKIPHAWGGGLAVVLMALLATMLASVLFALAFQ